MNHHDPETSTAPDSATIDMVQKILRQVIDPELGINIVDLGLIYETRVSDSDVFVTMTMTTTGCPLHESIVGAAEKSLKTYLPEKNIHVSLVWEPRWTPALLSPTAKQMLGFDE